MKAVLSVLGAFVLAVSISPTETNAMETESSLNLMDLPTKLRMVVFEQLDFIDLIRASKTHPENRILIEGIFRNVLKNRQFRMYFDEYSKTFTICYDSATVVARIAYEHSNEFEEILEFFQHFGHCITKLAYTYNPSVHDLYEQVHKQIKTYVAESVNEIRFDFNYKPMNGSLNDLITPYASCKAVELLNVAIDVETLQEMFPLVQSLHLEATEIEESLSNFPYLERLVVPPNWAKSKSHLPLLEQTLALNPQLKHLSTWDHEDLDVLQAINKIRPDLESLNISYRKFKGHVAEPFRFPNMKVFMFASFDSIDRIPFEFGNLEKIVINGNAQYFEAKFWVNIMMQNKKLRKVHTGFTWNRDYRRQIADGLPNLEEFTMID